MNPSQILDELFEVIRARKRDRPEGSYVVSLLDGGVDAVAAKLREECEEAIEAATDGDADHLAHEMADLLFHGFVLMAVAGTEPGDVYAKLAERFGVGGLVEKASRPDTGDAGNGGAGDAG